MLSLWAQSRLRRFERTAVGARIQPQAKAWFCLLSGQQQTLPWGRLRRFERTAVVVLSSPQAKAWFLPAALAAALRAAALHVCR